MLKRIYDPATGPTAYHCAVAKILSSMKFDTVYDKDLPKNVSLQIMPLEPDSHRRTIKIKDGIPYIRVQILLGMIFRCALPCTPPLVGTYAGPTELPLFTSFKTAPDELKDLYKETLLLLFPARNVKECAEKAAEKLKDGTMTALLTKMAKSMSTSVPDLQLRLSLDNTNEYVDYVFKQKMNVPTYNVEIEISRREASVLRDLTNPDRARFAEPYVRKNGIPKPKAKFDDGTLVAVAIKTTSTGIPRLVCGLLDKSEGWTYISLTNLIGTHRKDWIKSDGRLIRYAVRIKHAAPVKTPAEEQNEPNETSKEKTETSKAKTKKIPSK